MLNIENLNYRAGNFRLKNVCLEIAQGCCGALLGPTGSGKTLLLENIIGIRRPASGKIKINEADVTAMNPEQRNVSYVPQDICLFPHMTLIDNILYSARVRGVNVQAIKQEIDDLIDFLNISGLLKRYPDGLSGGERQRAALVRALAVKPNLLVLDEPFSSIDSALREETRRLLKDLLQKLKLTALIVTHDIDEAYFLGDIISIIIDGKIIQSGERDEIYNYPKKLEAAQFLGVRNIYDSGVTNVFEKSLVSSWGKERSVTISCGCAGSKFNEGLKIKWGIRPEAVFILKPGILLSADKKQNCFAAVIKKIYTRGKTHTLLCVLKGTDASSIEIDIHDAAFKKLELAAEKAIEISLNPDSIFIIS